MNGFTRGAELGVSTGRTTLFMCSRIVGLKMICVDLWAPQEKRDLALAETYDDWKHDAHYEHFKKATEQAFPGRVTIHRMKTADAAPLVPDGSLDFVFIDADHTYEGCLLDIDLWAPKVRKGGMVTGHDYNWPTVKRAVDERYPKAIITHDNVWVAQC